MWSVCMCPAHEQKLNRYPLDRVHSGSHAPGLYGNCSSGLHTLLYIYSSSQTPYDVFSDALPPESYTSPNDSLFLSSLLLFIHPSLCHFQFCTSPPPLTHSYLVCHVFQVAFGGPGVWRLEAECWIYRIIFYFFFLNFKPFFFSCSKDRAEDDKWISCILKKSLFNHLCVSD